MLLASGRLVSPHLIPRYPSPISELFRCTYSSFLPYACTHPSPARSSPLCRSSRHPIYLDISFSRQASKASGGEHSRAIYDLGHQQNGKSRRRFRRAVQGAFRHSKTCAATPSRREGGKGGGGSGKPTVLGKQGLSLQAPAMSGSFRRGHVCLSSTADAGPPPPTPSSLPNASCPQCSRARPIALTKTQRAS